MVKMSAKFDKEIHSSLVSIVFTSLFPYMSIVTLTFDLWPPKSIGFILASWLTCRNSATIFIRPSSDGTYYGMVMSVRASVRPSGSPSVHPSVRPSVRPSQFSALFSYMLWHIDLKFCVSLYFYARKIKFECHQFPSLFAGVMLLFNFKLLQICSFPHFSPTCFDILSSNFVYDFVLMYHRASLSVVILLQFLLELCLFVNLEYSKYTVFRTFLLHALTYWAEILHMTLFYCTTDQVRVSSICVNFCGSHAPFGT